MSRLIRVEADPAQGYNVAKPGSDQTQTVPGGPGHVILLGKNSTAANIGNPNDGRDTTKASCMTGLSMTGTPIEDCIPSDEDSHSIGTVVFGTDGSLFVGSGDGSNYTDVDWRALRVAEPEQPGGEDHADRPRHRQRPARQPVLRCHLSAVQPIQGLRAADCAIRSGSRIHPVTDEP